MCRPEEWITVTTKPLDAELDISRFTRCWVSRCSASGVPARKNYPCYPSSVSRNPLILYGAAYVEGGLVVTDNIHLQGVTSFSSITIRNIS